MLEERNKELEKVINNGTIKIDKADILIGLKKGFYSTLHLTEAVHQIRNIQNIIINIQNIRDMYAMIYDGAE